MRRRKQKKTTPGQILDIIPPALCILLGATIIPLFVDPIATAIFGFSMVYFGVKSLEWCM